MDSKIIVFLYLTILKVFNCKYANDSYYFYKIFAYNNRQRELLFNLATKSNAITFFNGITNQAAMAMEVAIKPWCEKEITLLLNDNLIQHYYIERISLHDRRIKPKTKKDDLFYSWYEYKSWVSDRTKKNMFLLSENIGQTYEKREIIMLIFCKKPSAPAVFIVGGEDGKDWLPPSIIINTIDTLLDNKNANYNTLVNKLCFYFIPILNPDGYVYSMKKDRFWSKNREKEIDRGCPDARDAIGTNIDRNFYFGKTANVFNGHCNSICFGYQSISQKETKALTSTLNSIATKFLAYINIQGFSNIIATPYANRHDEPPNHDFVVQLVHAACKKIYRKYYSAFYYGVTNRFFFNASGGSADWVKKNLNLPIVYTAHLKHRQFPLPQPADVEPLSSIFLSLLNDTLILSSDFYEVLFSHQASLYCKHIEIICVCFLLRITCHTLMKLN